MQLIDISYIENLKKGDIPFEQVDGLESLIPGYVKNLHAHIVNIINCIQNGEMDRVRGISHDIFGTAASYGFIGIQPIFEDIRALYEKLGHDDFVKMMEAIELYLSKMEKGLTQYEN